MNDRIEEVEASGDQPQRPDGVAQAELPGRILAQKRQELKWSIEDVARSLHLAPRQIQALESDNYSALPGMAVTRGFIRSYAKLLQLEPTALLQLIANATDGKAEDVSLRRPLPAKPFYVNRSLGMGRSSTSWKRSIVVILIGLPIALFVAWRADWLPPEWKAEVQALMSMQAATNTAGKPEVQDSQEVTKAGQKNTASLTQEAVTAEAGTPKAYLESAEKNLLFPGDASKAQNPLDSQRAASQEYAAIQAVGMVNSSDMLVLKVREDSWIEIRNSKDKLLLSRLAKAGESEAVPVREPIKLIIGNAAGVDVQLRGAPVELNATAKNNIARLTLN
jgi:cytoskeleton protein RodZ